MGKLLGVGSFNFHDRYTLETENTDAVFEKTGRVASEQALRELKALYPGELIPLPRIITSPDSPPFNSFSLSPRRVLLELLEPIT